MRDLETCKRVDRHTAQINSGLYLFFLTVAQKKINNVNDVNSWLDYANNGFWPPVLTIAMGQDAEKTLACFKKNSLNPVNDLEDQNYSLAAPLEKLKRLRIRSERARAEINLVAGSPEAMISTPGGKNIASIQDVVVGASGQPKSFAEERYKTGVSSNIYRFSPLVLMSEGEIVGRHSGFIPLIENYLDLVELTMLPEKLVYLLDRFKNNYWTAGNNPHAVSIRCSPEEWIDSFEGMSDMMDDTYIMTRNRHLDVAIERFAKDLRTDRVDEIEQGIWLDLYSPETLSENRSRNFCDATVLQVIAEKYWQRRREADKLLGKMYDNVIEISKNAGSLLEPVARGVYLSWLVSGGVLWDRIIDQRVRNVLPQVEPSQLKNFRHPSRRNLL